MATDTLEAWLAGTLVERLANTGDFATWADGAPLLEFSPDEFLSPPGIPTGEVVPSPSISADLVPANPTVSATVPYPIWLVELATSPVTYAASVDLDTLAQPYAGLLVGEPSITRQITDTFWGLVEVQQIKLTLANGTGRFTAAYLADLRGKALMVKRYDRTSGFLLTEWTGAVSQAGLSNGQLVLDGANLDLSIFEQEIPVGTVDTAEFPLAVDVGQVIPVVFGNMPKVPCLYVREDLTNNQYDFLLGWGTLGVTQVYRDGPNNTFYPVQASEYAVRTDLYSGKTVLRFPVAQLNFQNGRHKIFADIVGLQAERNPVRAVRTVLSNTSWGLKQTVNAASFDAAETLIASLNHLFCDGVMTSAVQAQDILRELLMFRGMRLGRNASLEWIITVDTQRTLVLVVGDGLGDGPRNVLDCTDRHGPALADTVSRVTIQYRLDLPTSTYLFRQSRTVADPLGRERLIPNRFIRDHVTADVVADYLGKRLARSQDVATVTLGQAARSLAEGDLIALTYPSQGYTGDVVEVQQVTKDLTEISAIIQGWDASIYQYTPGTLPGDNGSGSGTDYSRTNPDPVTGLLVIDTGTDVGLDGTNFAWTILRFTTPATNYALSLVKFRRHTTTEWSLASAVTAQGTVTVKVTGLVPGPDYDFTVQVQNMFGLVSVNDPVLLDELTGVDEIPPAAPTNCTAVRSAGGVLVTLTFEPPVDWGFCQFVRNTSPDVSEGAPGNVFVGYVKSTTFLDASALPSVTYHYAGSVVDTSDNESGRSPTATVLAV